MTRTLFLLAALLLVAIIGLAGAGLTANSPLALMGGLLCAMPAFFLALGAALGRASNEFAIVRKARSNGVAVPSKTVNPRQRSVTGEILG